MSDKNNETLNNGSPCECTKQDSQDKNSCNDEKLKKQDASGEKKDLNEEIERLNKLIEDKQAQIDEYKNRWLRTQADFDNFRKRTKKEMQDIHLYACEEFIKELLPVMDNFERALDSIEDKSNAFYKGVELIYQQILNIFEKFNVKQIKALGEPFDPRFHEAIMQEQSDEHENETVIEVFQKGYTYHSRVIRPSKVKVSKK